MTDQQPPIPRASSAPTKSSQGRPRRSTPRRGVFGPNVLTRAGRRSQQPVPPTGVLRSLPGCPSISITLISASSWATGSFSSFTRARRTGLHRETVLEVVRFGGPRGSTTSKLGWHTRCGPVGCASCRPFPSSRRTRPSSSWPTTSAAPAYRPDHQGGPEPSPGLALRRHARNGARSHGRVGPVPSYERTAADARRSTMAWATTGASSTTPSSSDDLRLRRKCTPMK